MSNRMAKKRGAIPTLFYPSAIGLSKNTPMPMFSMASHPLGMSLSGSKAL